MVTKKRGRRFSTAGGLFENHRPSPKARIPYAGITQIRFARVGGKTATLSARLNQAPLRALPFSCKHADSNATTGGLSMIGDWNPGQGYRIKRKYGVPSFLRRQEPLKP